MTRVIFLGLLAPWLAFGANDEFFIENFEAPTARLDAGGRWTELYDVGATRVVSSSSAHRGNGGLTITRMFGVVTSGPDTQLEWVSTNAARGDSWLRWWMRTRVTAPAPQALIGFGDTLVPNHLSLAHDPAGLFLTGYANTGTFFNPRTADLPDAGWHLYELNLRGMGSSDGGVSVIIDGTEVLDYRSNFDFPDAGVRQINVGYTYGAPRTMIGSVDYDDVRVSASRPTGIVRVSGVNGPWYAGTCVRLRVDFATSDRLVQRPLLDVNELTLAIAPSATFFMDANCTALVPMPFAQPAGTMVVDVYFQPTMAANYFVTVGASDLLPGIGSISVQPAMDGGSDAGGLDAGFDAGLDAGELDAGVDAGDVDAGLADGGAQLIDAGAPDSGVRTDAGPDVERDLTVGCGCGSGSGALLLLLGLLVRRRR